MNEYASSVNEIPSMLNVRGSILIFSGFLLEKLGLLREWRAKHAKCNQIRFDFALLQRSAV
jgi:hypothetical protein